MSLEAIKSQIGAFVEGRIYNLTFPQPTADATWPAIRLVQVSADPGATICGDGGDLADIRVQIDIAARQFSQMRTIRLQVLTAMETFPTPAIWVGEFEEYDSETKTYRSSLDYVLYPSSS